MDYTQLLQEIKEGKLDFSTGGGEYAPVGKYKGVLTKFEMTTSKAGSRLANLTFSMTAPKANVNQITVLRYSVDNEVGERMFAEMVLLLASKGVYKLPLPKIKKGTDSIIDTLASISSFENIEFNISIVKDKKNPKYTNTYINGVADEDYEPIGSTQKTDETNNDLDLGDIDDIDFDDEDSPF